jgi:hypothetical protein
MRPILKDAGDDVPGPHSNQLLGSFIVIRKIVAASF